MTDSENTEIPAPLGGVDMEPINSESVSTDLPWGYKEEASAKKEGDSSDFRKGIPKEYLEKGYMKDINDLPSLLKKLDGAEQLIGKRPAGIPDEKASEEEWTKFFEVLRPKEPSGYDLGTPENEPLDEKTKMFQDKIKKLFHTAGVSVRQGKELQKGFDELVSGLAEANPDKDDKNFEKLVVDTFGDKRDKALDTAKKMLKEHTPEGFIDLVNDLPNKALVAMASVLNAVHEKYIKEDSLDSSGASGYSATYTKESLREEGRRLMASEAFQSTFHPKHKAVFDEVTAIYEKIAKMQK